MLLLSVPLVVGLLVYPGPGTPSGESVLPIGRIVENVPSASAPGQRFTVYVPPTYDATRPAPILYLMDPRGRARVPAKLFQAAAERFGYILVSSHNTSSDVAIEANLSAMQAMWDDSHYWFSIDDRRVYIAGFSGTARTATLIATHRPHSIAGVIGAGAGFHPDVPPSRDTRFHYFATVGDVDYNFHELESLEHTLASMEVPHRLERFSGPHSWMPAELAMQAVEWLELRAMKAGLRTRDESLLEVWWTRDEAAAQARVSAVRPLSGSRRYAAMARDYEGLRDVSDVKARSARLATTVASKTELKRRQTETRRSNEWVNSAMQAIANAFPRGRITPLVPADDLARTLELSQMKATAASLVTEAALEAQRRLNQIEVQLGFYLPHEAVESAELTRAMYYLTLAVQINESSPVSWYVMAETYGRLDASAQALAALRRALDAGFRDLSRVETDPAFKGLRTDPGYAAILELLRKHGDTLDPLTVDRLPVLGLR